MPSTGITPTAKQPFLTSEYLKDHYVEQKRQTIDMKDLITLHFILYPQTSVGG